MKTHYTHLVAGLLLISSPLYAQTLSVKSGNVTYLFDSATTGLMDFSNGDTLTILDKAFDLNGLGVSVNSETVAENTVMIQFSGNTASAVVAGNIAQYVEVTVDGGHVTVNQLATVGDDTCGEITYALAGTSSNGSFTLEGSYKSSIELKGLTLTNPDGAAINIQNGKRTAIRVQEGTVNTLTDGASGSQKAALYCTGHLEFKQKGTLNVLGNKSHAIAAKEYIEVKNTVINITGAQKDGINCNQYFLIESGTVNISNTGDDGIQVAYKDATDREAEDTGSITIKGGELNIDVTAAACKALKCEGNFTMSKGTVNATVTGGGLWDSTKLKTKAAACIGVDGDMTVSGGTLKLTATGGGGKGINVDGNFSTTGGSFDIHTSGGVLAYVNGNINNNYTGNTDNLNSDYKSSPKGIKVDGAVVIDDGTFFIWTQGAGGEGIESKTTLTINGGSLTIQAYEDGTNSSSHTYINGGDITVTTKTGDAIDSNGMIYVNGGNLRVIGAGGSEQGFDAGDGYTIEIKGGTILAAGGGNSAPTTSASTQAYVTLNMTLTAGQTVTVSDASGVVATFIVPEAYGTITNAPAMGPGGGNWGWGGTSGNALLLSTPDMVSGTTYTISNGTTSTTSAAKLTGGSSGPGGGH